jgi:alanine dehydrogenase
MKIGLPKEIKDNEYRVGLTPAGVQALSDAGHTLFVQKSAGEGSALLTNFMLMRARRCWKRRTTFGAKAI